MFREEIKVLDCTIRDGGLINNHLFTDEFVRAVYKGLSEAGIDYMEMGYRSSRKHADESEYGPWKFCDDEKLLEITDGIESDVKLSIMLDSYRVDDQEFKRVDESPVDMIRIATYVKGIDKAITLEERMRDLGYETTINIMAISTENEFDLLQALEQVGKTKVPIVYVVDSFGYYYCEQIENMVKLFQKYLPGKEIGMHCHNNQQLAFSNTIEGVIHNANYLDASIFGIGRGAGNCPLELLMGFLKNPKFDQKPVLEIIEKYMIKMREEIEWGYIIPYVITGNLNEHPRSAIAVRQTDKKDNYVEFFENIYDSMT